MTRHFTMTIDEGKQVTRISGSEFTIELLKEYIRMRRNAINKLIKAGIIPGVLDSVEINKMRGVIEEFETMEKWFNE